MRLDADPISTEADAAHLRIEFRKPRFPSNAKGNNASSRSIPSFRDCGFKANFVPRCRGEYRQIDERQQYECCGEAKFLLAKDRIASQTARLLVSGKKEFIAHANS